MSSDEGPCLPETRASSIYLSVARCLGQPRPGRQSEQQYLLESKILLQLLLVTSCPVPASYTCMLCCVVLSIPLGRAPSSTRTSRWPMTPELGANVRMDKGKGQPSGKPHDYHAHGRPPRRAHSSAIPSSCRVVTDTFEPSLEASGREASASLAGWLWYLGLTGYQGLSSDADSVRLLAVLINQALQVFQGRSP